MDNYEPFLPYINKKFHTEFQRRWKEIQPYLCWVDKNIPDSMINRIYLAGGCSAYLIGRTSTFRDIDLWYEYQEPFDNPDIDIMNPNSNEYMNIASDNAIKSVRSIVPNLEHHRQIQFIGLKRAQQASDIVDTFDLRVVQTAFLLRTQNDNEPRFFTKDCWCNDETTKPRNHRSCCRQSMYHVRILQALEQIPFNTLNQVCASCERKN